MASFGACGPQPPSIGNARNELFHDRGQEWPNRRSWPERAAGGPKLASKMLDARNVSTLNCRISGSNGQDRDGAAAILHPSGIGVARRPRPPAAPILTSDEPQKPGTGKFVKFLALRLSMLAGRKPDSATPIQASAPAARLSVLAPLGPKPARGRSAADLGSCLAIPWFAPTCCPRRARGGEPSLVRDEGILGYCILH
jgi:hypothetical protein